MTLVSVNTPMRDMSLNIRRRLRLIVCMLALLSGTAPAQSTVINTKGFLDVFQSRLAAVNHLSAKPGEPVDVQIQRICPFDSNAAVRLILYAYGAVFVGSDKVHI